MAACSCSRDKSGRLLRPAQQDVRVRREKRNGKFVTVIAGLDPHAHDLVLLLKEFKSSLGAGGTVNKTGEIEIQGDHADKLTQHFKNRGFAAKRSGG